METVGGHKIILRDHKTIVRDHKEATCIVNDMMLLTDHKETTREAVWRPWETMWRLALREAMWRSQENFKRSQGRHKVLSGDGPITASQSAMQSGTHTTGMQLHHQRSKRYF